MVISMRIIYLGDRTNFQLLLPPFDAETFNPLSQNAFKLF